MPDKLQNLIDDFDLLDEWEDKYRYIIELGRALPAYDEAHRDAAHKVAGCASQVWIHASRSEGSSGTVLNFSGDSDALIVKGLTAIVFMIFSGLTPEQILARDAGELFKRLGLSDHLTQQRSNGLASMVKRIKAEAQAALQG